MGLQTPGVITTLSTEQWQSRSDGKVDEKIIRTAWNGRYLDGDKLCKALLQYSNTPSLRDGLFPAQKLFGHPVQDTLPAHPKSFDPQWQTNLDKAAEKAECTQRAAERYYNRQAHSLPEIHVGSQVALQDPRTRLWDTYGVVIRMGQHCQYIVKTESRRVLTRNRRFLWRWVPLPAQPQSTWPIDEPLLHANVPQQQPSDEAHQPLGAISPIQPRRSNRPRKPTNRLIEDPYWNS